MRFSAQNFFPGVLAPAFDFPRNSVNLAAMHLTEQMTRLAKQAKAASRELAQLTTAEKNSCLLAMAAASEKNADAIKQANALDLEVGAKLNLSAAMLDRLLHRSVVFNIDGESYRMREARERGGGARKS